MKYSYVQPLLLGFVVIFLAKHDEVAVAQETTNIDYVKVKHDGTEQYAVGIEHRTLNEAYLSLGPLHQGEYRTVSYNNEKTSYIIITKQMGVGPHVDIDIKKVDKGEYCFAVKGKYNDAHIVNCEV